MKNFIRVNIIIYFLQFNKTELFDRITSYLTEIIVLNNVEEEQFSNEI